ncbi:uncharacterized protein [Rutidosis leptorrhynchoides]|uniref:uncharacterized protein n=1 Tax=Rutidosis leptorrhynchoides TaxID=125765 RepID=UPI003A990662
MIIKNLRNFSKLIISLILLISLTYFIYSLQILTSFPSYSSSNQSPNIYPFHQSQPIPESKTNLSHIVFGIAGSAQLWNHRKNYVKVWWRPNQMRGAVWLDKELNNKTSIVDDDHSLPQIKISSDVTTKFKSRNLIAIRISRIVLETFKLGFHDVRWFVMGDDDTVFIIDNLVRVLAKYDHNQLYYIGSSSESHAQNIHFNFGMAYGGGGFAISYPLAKVLETKLGNCIRTYPNLVTSDSLIHACMAEIGVPLTREPGFHQIDVYGNILGLLMAHPIQPFISLHHLDKVNPIFPNMDRIKSLQKLQIPAKLDSAGLMQQSICYDKANSWTVSVSWGYAVQIIRGIVPARDMEIPERTFLDWRKRADIKGYSINTRPSSRNPCQRPFFYHLSNASFDSKTNRTASEYVSHQLGNPKCNWRMDDSSMIDRVQVYKVPDPFLWDKPPRRNCCRVMPAKKKGTMVIDVGPCIADEIINV